MSKIKGSLTRLTIANAVFYAYHGVKDEEQILGGKYEVDLELEYDARQAVLSDDVSNALNYEEAMYCISEVMNGDACSLMETIVYEILTSLMEKFSALESATVRVRKYSVPMRQPIDFVEAEQSMTRDL